MFMYVYVYNVALCDNTVRNVALAFCLVSYPVKGNHLLTNDLHFLILSKVLLHINVNAFCCITLPPLLHHTATLAASHCHFCCITLPPLLYHTATFVVSHCHLCCITLPLFAASHCHFCCITLPPFTCTLHSFLFPIVFFFVCRATSDHLGHVLSLEGTGPVRPGRCGRHGPADTHQRLHRKQSKRSAGLEESLGVICD